MIIANMPVKWQSSTALIVAIIICINHSIAFKLNIFLAPVCCIGNHFYFIALWNLSQWSLPCILPYSRKYWRELNLAVGPQIAIAKNIGGFKFGGSVRDRHMYICKYEILAHFNLAVAKVDRQTAKFNSPPKFPAIRYVLCMR